MGCSAYTVSISIVADANVEVSLVAAAANDSAGNGNTASNTQSLVSDCTAPTVTLAATESLVNGAFTVNFTFSESVIGFDLA